MNTSAILHHWIHHLPELVAEGATLEIAPHPEQAHVFPATLQLAGVKLPIVIGVLTTAGRLGVESLLANLKQAIRRRPGTWPLVLATFLGEQRRARCRQAGIGYADLSGNCYIQGPGILIDRTTATNRLPPSELPLNLFTDRASHVLRALLGEPNRSWGVRELQRRTGVSVGFISRLVGALHQEGFLRRQGKGFVLQQPAELLEQWTRAYSYKKSPASRWFCPRATPERILQRLREVTRDSTHDYALTLHAGAALVAPHTRFPGVHLYIGGVERYTAEAYWREQLELIDSPGDANVHLLWPYYRSGVFFDRRWIDGLSVVSDIQLYLDLVHFPARGEEQAAHLYQMKLAHLEAEDLDAPA